MPSTNNTGKKASRKSQPQAHAAGPIHAVGDALASVANTVTTAVGLPAMFDHTPHDPPADEQSAVDPAVSKEPSAVPSSEGDDAKPGALLTADPALAVAQDVSPPGEEPHPSAEGPHPTEAAQAPAPNVVTDQVTDLGAERQADEEQSFAASGKVRLGQAIGLLHRMPLEDVLAYTKDFVDKIDALTSSAPVQALQPRMRATEGRCAPIYFVADTNGEPEHLFHGAEALSAAIALGLQKVSVITIPLEDAGAAQSYLATQAGALSNTSADDDLVMQVNAYRSSS